MKKATVLVVDDERFFISLLIDILSSKYHVISADNGYDCLKLVKQESVDLILLDIIMPNVNGFDVCKLLKEQPESRDIPVIFLTVKNDVENEVKGFEIGAVDYLSKPISSAIVHARVKTQLALRKAQKELKRYSGELENLVAQRTVELTREMTKTQKAYENLHFLANYDQLTQLPNRNLFNERLSYASKQTQRNGIEFAFLLIDLDRFKQVNDIFGHHVGDLLLCQVSNRLTENLRGVDTVARLGGDEFAVILTDKVSKKSVATVATKILAQLKQPFEIENHIIFITGSIGITFFPTDTEDPSELMKLADMAMYHAKEQGKNTFDFYTPVLTEYVNQRQELEKHLYLAIQKNELFLNYQPIIDTQSQAIVGAEALLRWFSPKHGLVPTEKIISIAEESNLIFDIGNWVLSTACKQVMHWRKAKESKNFYISINVSPRQFNKNGNNAFEVDKTLNNLNFPSDLLTLEITENLLLDNSTYISERLSQLKHTGVSLSIDDFGTGYSSLSYLRQFPVDSIKIDQSFIKNLKPDSEDAVLVKAILAMGHSLNLSVVAEGVETREHFEFLKNHGCDRVQGHFFCKPVSADDFETILHDNQQLQAYDHGHDIKATL